MDVVILSRAQFALTAAFHYIFPPLTIGLSLIIVFMEGLCLAKKQDPLCRQTARFWIQVFGLLFTLGVASGIVLEFEFGTNWANYSRFVGDVFGSPLAAEAIFAFFLESVFLGVLLLGANRVGPGMRFFSALMVSLGAHMSALWIVIANSWQQTPAGFHIVGEAMTARAEITDFWAMVFNPSSVNRVSHVLMGAWQAGAFFVLGIGAYYLLIKRHREFAKASMRITLPIALIASLGQLVTGHSSARIVAKYQPAKLAAFEGHYEAFAPAGLYLGGWVDEQNERVINGVKIPGMLSFLVSGSFKEPITGLRAFPPEDRPPVNLSFQFYHAMIAFGIGMIALSLGGVFFWWRKTLFEKRWLLWLFAQAVASPLIANILGWFAAEIGRQPWIVYNVLRTSEGVSKNLTASQVASSLIMFTCIYALLLVLAIYLVARKVQRGPREESVGP